MKSPSLAWYSGWRVLALAFIFAWLGSARGQEVPPRLDIQRAAGGNAVISWPAALSNYVLEAAGSLRAPAAWNVFNGATALSGNNRVATVPALGLRYYRLRSGETGGLRIEAETAGSQLIRAAQGGTVELAGGALRLAVPAGALAQDAEITITNRLYSQGAGLPLRGQIMLQPHGLRFAQPAALTFRLPENTEPQTLLFYSVSESAEPYRSGSELSLFEPITNYTYQASTREITLPLQHFSFINFNLDRFNSLYMAFDIPGKFLKKGDLLFCLNTHSLGWQGWHPGHAGMYLGTQDPLLAENNGATTIESTTAGLGYVDGVQFADFEKFKTMFGQHVYLGARRSPVAPTEEQRLKIAQWAVGKKGTPYGLVGGGGISSDAKLSCVGLNERAYEEAGINIVPGLVEAPLSPQLQFAYTRPVNEVTVKVGEPFQMFIMGIVNPSYLPWPPVWSFSTSKQYHTATMTADAGSPAEKALNGQRAKFTAAESFTLFAFKPSVADAGLEHRFHFTVNAEKTVGAGEVTETLTVKVKPAYARQDPPVIKLTPISGVLPKEQMVVTATSAEVPGQNGGKYQLTWPLPPDRLEETEVFAMAMSAQAEGAFPARIQDTQASRFPTVLIASPGFGEGAAFPDRSGHAGYNYIGRCIPGDRNTQCFDFMQGSKTMPGQLSFSGGRAVFQVTAQWYGFRVGDIIATIEWEYKPAE